MCHTGDDGLVMLESGSSATLSLHSVVSASCRSQLASCPELFFDVQPVPPLAVSTSMGALQKVINDRSAFAASSTAHLSFLA